MKSTNRSAVMRVIVFVFVLGMILAAPVAAASAATGTSVKRISVTSVRVYTDTGVAVHSGDTITIRASGIVHFGSKPIDHLTPAGLALRSGCDRLMGRRESKATPMPAPGIECWSLIGKIGLGAPFAVAREKTFRSTSSGELFLGVNDDYLRDNRGAFSATIVLSAASAPTKTAPAKHSSNSTMLVIVGLLVVAALIAIAVFARFVRARRTASSAAPVRRTEPPAPVPAPAPVAVRPLISVPDVEATLPAAEAFLPVAEADPQSQSVTDSPAEGDFTDVNIFEVEFPDSTSLRVGYNYFPEGTVVRFRIAQRARAAATGSFVTAGGGSRYHFVTVELGQELEPNPDGADVGFTWEVGGVPFQYSVRRVPAG